MSIELDALRYLGVYGEPAGSYAVDHSGTPGDFLAVPYQEGSLQLSGTREMLDPQTAKMKLDGGDVKVIGPRRCSASLSMALHSHGLDLDGDVTAPTTANWALMRILEAVMGGSSRTANASAQTEVQAGSTTTVIDVTSGHGSSRGFAAGQVIGVEVVAGLLELREIESVSTDAVTLKEALSGTPITSSAVRGGVTFYLTQDPDTSLQLHVEGNEAQDAAVYAGLQGAPAISYALGQIPVLSMALEGSYWSRLASSSATVPSYTNYSPLAAVSAELTAPTVGSATRVLVEQSSSTFEPQVTFARVLSGQASENVARMRRQPSRPAMRGTFTAPLEDLTWYNARDNKTNIAIFQQLGNLAGGSVLISAPTVQIVDVQPGPSETGISGQVVTWEAREDQEIGSAGGASDLLRSAFRLHFV